jgi:hypothetical protein
MNGRVKTGVERRERDLVGPVTAKVESEGACLKGWDDSVLLVHSEQHEELVRKQKFTNRREGEYTSSRTRLYACDLQRISKMHEMDGKAWKMCNTIASTKKLTQFMAKRVRAIYLHEQMEHLMKHNSIA